MAQQKQYSKMPILFLMGGGLLLIALAIGLLSEGTSAVPTPATRSEEEQDAAVPRVTLAEAKAALDSNSAIFLDVRSAEAYQSQHITSSINIPLAELESRMSELDPQQWIITYCT